MKLIKLTRGVTILWLLMGCNALAMGEQENVSESTERSALLAKSVLMSEKRDQTVTSSDEPQLIQVADDQPVPSSKNVEPLYQPPRRGAPGGRVGGGTRGPSLHLPLLYALVPNHVAMTAEQQPQLLWYLSESTSLPLEFTIVETGGVEPVLEVGLSTPVDAGIQMISLVQHDLRLEAGRTYQWFVSLIPDPSRRSKDIIAGGMLEMDELPEGIVEDVKEGTPLEATKLLANAGFWYDAMGMISRSIQRNPADQALREVRAVLLEQVDLGLVAQVDRQREF